MGHLFSINFIFIFLFTFLLNISWTLSGGDPNDLTFNIDKSVIIREPITKGLHDFDENGKIGNEPLNIFKKLHYEVIQTVQALDHKKRIKYLITLCDSANKEMKELRLKFDDMSKPDFEELMSNKSTIKADAFILVVGQGSLLSNVILYFPNTLHNLLRKNPDFDQNVKWTISFIVKYELIGMESYKKLFHLVQQELEMIPKEENYVNPYKEIYQNTLPPPKSTEKPKRKKKAERGPRLSRGSEL